MNPDRLSTEERDPAPLFVDETEEPQPVGYSCGCVLVRPVDTEERCSSHEVWS